MNFEESRRRLGDIAAVIAGQSPEGKFYNEIGKGHPFYQGKKEFREKYIGPPTTWTSQVTKEALADDILMSVRAPVGPVNFSTERICIGRGLAAIRCREGLDKEFLFYFLLSKEAEISGREGAVFASINKSEVEAIQIPVPTLPEQRRIVGILDEAFEGIATAKAHAEKNLQNARALFESQLGFAFGQAWGSSKLLPLAELATDITDGDHLPPPKTSSGIPFITIGNIVKATRQIDFSATFKVSREYFDSLKHNRRPQRGDVLYTVTGSFGIPVLIDDDREFCFQRHIGLIRPRSGIDSRWLSYLMLSPQVFAQADAAATGAAQRTVALKSLRAIVVPVMSTSEQVKLVDHLDALGAETQRLESIYQRKLAALDALKKSLLHQAFSGQL